MAGDEDIVAVLPEANVLVVLVRLRMSELGVCLSRQRDGEVGPHNPVLKHTLMIPVDGLSDAGAETVDGAALPVPLVAEVVVPLAKINAGNVAERGDEAGAGVSEVRSRVPVAIRIFERRGVDRPCRSGAVFIARLAGACLTAEIPVVHEQHAGVERAHPVIGRAELVTAGERTGVGMSAELALDAAYSVDGTIAVLRIIDGDVLSGGTVVRDDCSDAPLAARSGQLHSELRIGDIS